MVNAINIFLNVVDNATKEVKKVEKQIKGFGSKVESNFKKIQNAFLGVGLSLLFTGMAIKRVSDAALRSIFNTAQTAYGEVSEFAILTNRLTANWEFFKFTLVDALMQSGLFQMFIGFLIKVINFFSRLSPRMKRFMVTSLVAISAISGAMMVLGQVTLGLLAPLTIVGTAGSAAMLPILIAVAAITVAVIGLIAIWSSGMSKAQKFASSWLLLLGVVITAILGVSAAGVALFAAFALIVKGLIFIWENWDAVWGNMKLAFMRFVHEIQRAFEWMINGIVRALNFLIRATNKLPGMDIDTIGRVDFTSDNLPKLVAQANRVSAAQGNVTQENNVVINQREGEDSEALAQRVIDIISNQTERMIQSPQK